MDKKTVRDIDLTGKKVLLRVDYNVPIKDGQVGDTLRIEASFPTIHYLLEQNCALILISHLGRPDGKPDPKYSLQPVAKKAAQLLGELINFVPDCIGAEAEAAAGKLLPGEIILLENLRFHPEEEANDQGFAKQLAALAEVFVDDAFAVIHRAHASTVGVTKFLPSVAGLLVEKEVSTISKALNSPQRPVLAIIGGAKIADKIEVLDNLVNKVDRLMIGGAMANTFLAAQGMPVGKSIYEANKKSTAEEVLDHAASHNVEVLLPTDVVVTTKLEDGAQGRTVAATEVGKDDIIADIGPATIEAATEGLSGTVIWNGPLGVTEISTFAAGSRLLSDRVVAAGVTSIIGGGDTAAFVDDAGLHDKFTLVSTGGGASLDLMAGKQLPGVEALMPRSSG